MSGNAYINLFIAIVVGVIIGSATYGLGYGLIPGLIAFSLTDALLTYAGPHKGIGASGIKNATAEDWEMASSSESIAIPVIFGVVRNPGNYIRYDKATYRADPQYTSASSGGGGGGKGGGGGGQSATYISSYKYYMSFDYGLCQGPIRRVRAIVDGTSLASLGNSDHLFGTGEESFLTTIGDTASGGDVRIYRGSSTQTRVVNEVYSQADSNYRDVCFACFQNFYIGESPQPHTYLFELQRWPDCRDADGNVIAGLVVSGSLDSGDDAYEDANPAAVIYEMMTNKKWGCGISPDLFYIDEFKKASAYFAANKIGLSVSLESQDELASYIDAIRQHCALIVTWDGSKIGMRCMLDIISNSTIADVINAESVSDVRFSRPAWPAMTNELKLKFTNRHNSFKVELVQVQDTAAIINAGIINSSEISMNGIPSREIAEAQGSRLLSEMSFPRASLTFKLNRASRLRAGDLFEFQWSEWSAGKTFTYWRVQEITDKAQQGDGIAIMAVEDLNSTPYEGEPSNYAPLVPAFENGGYTTNGSLNLGGDGGTPEPDSISPIVLMEENIWLSQGAPNMIIGAENGGYGHIRFTNYWQLDSGGNANFMGNSYGFGITGALVTSLPATGRHLNRSTERKFQISFTHDVEAVIMMASANKTPLPADHFAVITGGKTDIMVIGQEILQIGKVTASTTPGAYDVTAYLRAQYGTDLQAHSSGAKFLFISKWTNGFEFPLPSDLPEGVAVNIIQHAGTTRVESTASFEAPGPFSGEFVRLGMRPFTPDLYSRLKVGSTWTIKVRARWHSNGAFSSPDLEQDCNNLTLTIPPGYLFFIQPYASGVASADIGQSTPTFSPDNGTDGTGGLLTFSITAAGADEIRIWPAFNGKKSLLPLSVAA